MIVLLSPSKSMDMAATECDSTSQPAFLDRSETLISKIRSYSVTELMAFMTISVKLAELNHQRFQTWKPPFSTGNAKQAVLAFTGDVYDGLAAGTLEQHDLQFAQAHLRILSGLYGLLRPLDLIQPYRLEMGRPLETGASRNLYEFWRTTITEALNQMDDTLVVNLASNEYFKAIDQRTLDKHIVTPVFKDEKNGRFKVISFYAKKARGRMARHIIQNRIKTADELLEFSADGYVFNAGLSQPNEPVFTRAAS